MVGENFGRKTQKREWQKKKKRKWHIILFYFILFFFNVYLFLRETETECKWVGAEREGGTELEAGLRL